MATIPPRSGQWEDDELDIKEAAWYNPASWAVTKDIAHGNFGNVGKDLGNAAKGFAQDTSNWSNDAFKFTKDHWKGIAEGVAVGALAATGVGIAADAGIFGGLAADAATTATETATETAATTAADTAATSAADTAATTTAEDTAASTAEDTASTVNKEDPNGLFKNGPRQKFDALVQKAKDSPIGQKASDFLDSTPGKALKAVAPSAVVNKAMSPDSSSQTPAAPAPAPVAAPQQIAMPNADTTTSAEGSAIVSPASTSAANIIGAPIQPVDTIAPMAGKQDKILDLVEQFGLHPEDIKRSLTSWA